MMSKVTCRLIAWSHYMTVLKTNYNVVLTRGGVQDNEIRKNIKYQVIKQVIKSLLFSLALVDKLYIIKGFCLGRRECFYNTKHKL